MRLSDFDFDLPEDRIAVRPVRPRSAARLLVAGPDWHRDRRVFDLPDILRPGDRLVVNNTRVIPARLSGVRRRAGPEGATQARVEATLLEPQSDGTWSALVKPARKVRDGERLDFGSGLEAEVVGRGGGQMRLRFDRAGEDFQAALEAVGAMPLPPYIAARRGPDDRDRTDYQTVFARHAGAVAAPTASLHFDHAVLAALRAAGVDFTEVTLHVGAGTFLPVTVDDVRAHRMHAEWGQVSAPAAAEIAATRAAGGRIIPVGTTALRLIESAAQGGEIAAFEGATDLFITPGFRFRVADGLMTNFHLPRSTLMMLVAALMGRERILALYDHAIASGYRFFSYGDASLLLPGGACGRPEPTF